jgi:hypothetical protein
MGCGPVFMLSQNCRTPPGTSPQLSTRIYPMTGLTQPGRSLVHYAIQKADVAQHVSHG